MISDRDVWAAALLIVKRYGDDVMLEGGGRALRNLRPIAGVSPMRRAGARSARPILA
jgi:hypothetical protein